jgi:hypothetical protein
MQRHAIPVITVFAAIVYTGCSSQPTTLDRVVRLPDGRPVAILIPPTPRAQSAKLPPIVGDVGAVSQADIRAAIAATFPLENIRFIRVADHNTIQLHHEAFGDRCLHYDDMRRKKGKWTYKVTVVVVKDCGYVPML